MREADEPGSEWDGAGVNTAERAAVGDVLAALAKEAETSSHEALGRGIVSNESGRLAYELGALRGLVRALEINVRCGLTPSLGVVSEVRS